VLVGLEKRLLENVLGILLVLGDVLASRKIFRS